MGRTKTSKYALEMDGVTARCWWVGKQEGNIPGDGKPTEANLIKFIESFNRSLEFGGANYHITKALGYIPYPRWARIVENRLNGAVVAEWTAPAFMAV